MRTVCPGVLKFLGDRLGPKSELSTKFHQNRTSRSWDIKSAWISHWRTEGPGAPKFLGDPLGPKPELPTKFHQNRMKTVGEKAVTRICGQTDRQTDRHETKNVQKCLKRVLRQKKIEIGEQKFFSSRKWLQCFSITFGILGSKILLESLLISDTVFPRRRQYRGWSCIQSTTNFIIFLLIHSWNKRSLGKN